MSQVKLNIDESLLVKLQEISDYYEQTLEETFEEMARIRIRNFDTTMKEIESVSDEDVEFLFNDFPDYKHPNPNHKAKIIPLFQ